jgi:hypothetical protein
MYAAPAAVDSRVRGNDKRGSGNEGYAVSKGVGVALAHVLHERVIMKIPYKVASVSTLCPAAPDLRNARFVTGRLRLWSLVFHAEESHWNAQ